MTELVRTIYKSHSRIHNTLQFHNLIFWDTVQKAITIIQSTGTATFLSYHVHAVGMVVEKSNALTTLKTVTLKVMWKRRIHVLKTSMERYSSREITSTFFKYSNSCLSQTLSIVTLLCALLTITIKQGFYWREFTRTFHTGNQFFQNSPKCGDLVSYLKS